MKFTDGATVLSSSSFKNADGSNFTGTLDITKTDFTGTGKMTLLASGTNDNFTTLKLAYDDATKTNPKTLDATTPSVVVKSGGDETLSNKVVLTTTGGITHTVSLDTTNTYRNVLYTIAGDGNVTVTKVDLKNCLMHFLFQELREMVETEDTGTLQQDNLIVQATESIAGHKLFHTREKYFVGYVDYITMRLDRRSYTYQPVDASLFPVGLGQARYFNHLLVSLLLRLPDGPADSLIGLSRRSIWAR